MSPDKGLDQPVGVAKALVPDQRLRLDIVKQRPRAGQIVSLAWREPQRNGVAKGIDERMDFGGQSAAGSTDRLFAVFFVRRRYAGEGAHDRGVDHPHVFVVVIARQQSENAVKNSALRPPAEALVDDLPIAETLWKIPPRDAGPKSIQNRFDEQSVVGRRASHVAFAARKKNPGSDPIGRRAVHNVASVSPSKSRPPMSQSFADLGIPPL